MHDILKFSDRISCLPVVHGSGDFAVEVRRIMLSESFDCVAVPLPESFRSSVEEGITHLPNITIAIQPETGLYSEGEWREDDDGEHEETPASSSYVPIDPCQPVIAALRLAIQERIPRAYVDLEVENFEPHSDVLPDPYAIKQVPPEKFAAAVMIQSPPPATAQLSARIQHMARRLRELERTHRSILFVCSVSQWHWIRDAYRNPADLDAFEPDVYETELFSVEPATLLFLLGELPFITGLYEQSRFNLDSDENLSVDGVKEMLLTAREKYQTELKGRGRKITPHLLSTYLRYVRNLCLIERRMTPDLYTLVIAAKQLAGDLFAISLAETAREYPFRETLPYGTFQMSVDKGQLPDGRVSLMKNRLEGPPISWRTCPLNRKPTRFDQEKWSTTWNSYGQCSWPPEDVAIERFRTHVKDRALSIMGNDLARIEKFTTSLKDGLDIRETLRNWHTGNLYVKEQPPSRGNLDCVLMLFDSPADPREYTWRVTWHAEHHDESTLAFFATQIGEGLVGPGIAAATYGGALFLFPPRPIMDVWSDPRLHFTDTLEERLLAAACLYSHERHIAILSGPPPGVGWRRLAKRYGKKLVHVPLAHFSQETVQQLRIFHVLNGKHVRSYAEHFIRKA